MHHYFSNNNNNHKIKLGAMCAEQYTSPQFLSRAYSLNYIWLNRSILKFNDNDLPNQASLCQRLESEEHY